MCPVFGRQLKITVVVVVSKLSTLLRAIRVKRIIQAAISASRTPQRPAVRKDSLLKNLLTSSKRWRTAGAASAGVGSDISLRNRDQTIHITAEDNIRADTENITVGAGRIHKASVTDPHELHMLAIGPPGGPLVTSGVQAGRSTCGQATEDIGPDVHSLQDIMVIPTILNLQDLDQGTSVSVVKLKTYRRRKSMKKPLRTISMNL